MPRASTKKRDQAARRRMGLDYRRLDVLVRAPRNPKLHEEDALAASMLRFGYTMPILIDEVDNGIRAGHGRLDTLIRLYEEGAEPPELIDVDADGMWLVPVVVGVRFTSPEEAEAYLIADNEIARRGGNDEKVLAAMLADHMKLAHGLEGTGWTEEQSKDLIAQMQKLEEDARRAASAGDGRTPPNDFPEHNSGTRKTVACPKCGFLVISE